MKFLTSGQGNVELCYDEMDEEEAALADKPEPEPELAPPVAVTLPQPPTLTNLTLKLNAEHERGSSAREKEFPKAEIRKIPRARERTAAVELSPEGTTFTSHMLNTKLTLHRQELSLEDKYGERVQQLVDMGFADQDANLRCARRDEGSDTSSDIYEFKCF